jgi:predicted Rossmann fold nucleotide-binding protein DprA/Smf involved in DNA uptake
MSSPAASPGASTAPRAAALDAGGARLPCSAPGPDTIYPRQHRELAQRIVKTRRTGQ